MQHRLTLDGMTFGLLWGLALCACSSEPPPAAAGGAGGEGGVAGAVPLGGSSGHGGSMSGGSASGAGAASGGLAGLAGQGGGGAAGAAGGVGSGGAAAGAAGAANVGGEGGRGGEPAESCVAGAIFCDGFERYAPASPPTDGWTPSVRGEGKIVVDTTRAYGGKHSLHVTGRMNADRANISRAINADDDQVYVRFMLYTVSYPASAGVHTRLLRLGTSEAASGAPYSSYSFASYNGTAIEKVNSIYLRDPTTKLSDASLLNRWVCWELAVDRSGGVGKVKVQIWADGRDLKLSAAGSSGHGMTSTSWDPIPFEVLMLGLDGFQADPQSADFWLDDLALTTSRLGCPEKL